MDNLLAVFTNWHHMQLSVCEHSTNQCKKRNLPPEISGCGCFIYFLDASNKKALRLILVNLSESNEEKRTFHSLEVLVTHRRESNRYTNTPDLTSFATVNTNKIFYHLHTCTSNKELCTVLSATNGGYTLLYVLKVVDLYQVEERQSVMVVWTSNINMPSWIL